MILSREFSKIRYRSRGQTMLDVGLVHYVTTLYIMYIRSLDFLSRSPLKLTSVSVNETRTWMRSTETYIVNLNLPFVWSFISRDIPRRSYWSKTEECDVTSYRQSRYGCCRHNAASLYAAIVWELVVEIPAYKKSPTARENFQRMMGTGQVGAWHYYPNLLFCL